MIYPSKWHASRLVNILTEKSTEKPIEKLIEKPTFLSEKIIPNRHQNWSARSRFRSFRTVHLLRQIRLARRILAWPSSLLESTVRNWDYELHSMKLRLWNQQHEVRTMKSAPWSSYGNHRRSSRKINRFDEQSLFNKRTSCVCSHKKTSG